MAELSHEAWAVRPGLGDDFLALGLALRFTRVGP